MALQHVVSAHRKAFMGVLKCDNFYASWNYTLVMPIIHQNIACKSCCNALEHLTTDISLSKELKIYGRCVI